MSLAEYNQQFLIRFVACLIVLFIAIFIKIPLFPKLKFIVGFVVIYLMITCVLKDYYQLNPWMRKLKEKYLWDSSSLP
jgi:hypothetical protein